MWDVNSYTIIASIFPRLLGAIYLFTFGAFLFQIKGLIGEQGILPLKDFIFVLRRYYPKKKYWIAPMLFWFNASDTMIMGVTICGVVFSIMLIFGFIPPLMLGLLYVFYLSIVSGGQDFLGFGWEGFLLETTVHAFFLSLTPVPNLMVWFSLNLLLFRFHFYAGLVKLQSRDPNWRNLRALTFHYLSQPLPNTQAWFMDKLPMRLQEFSCILMFFGEMILPFGIFATEEIRLWVCLGMVLLQFFIWFTGNFSFLNHLTVVLCVILLNNDFLTRWGLSAPTPAPSSLWLNGLQAFFGSILLLLQLARGWHQIWPNRYIHRIMLWLSPFHLANRYGIFAVMTTKRYEIIIEGSHDGIEWKEYTFQFKPSEISRRPRRISPYQPRIDWQAWFLPFSDYESEPWFKNFLACLLKGNQTVLKLLRGNPFPKSPPKYIRAVIYDYTYSSFDELRATGNWWRRVYVGYYTPMLTLRKTSEE